MKKSTGKTILVLALAVVLVASIGLVSCNKNGKTNNSSSFQQKPYEYVHPDPGDGTPQHDKAIIYVTALFGGGLYNDETLETVWDPFYTEFDLYDHWDSYTIERLEKFKAGKPYTKDASKSTIYDFAGVLAEFEKVDKDWDKIGSALSYAPGTLLYDMSLDQDGNGIDPHIVPANNKPVDADGERLNCYYGAVGIYKQFILNTRRAFGEEYDCIMFNQDWRKSPADSGKVLEDFINEKGYKKVIFMSHSMGGPVVNSYLGRSEANRNKVQMYLAYAPATLGSFDAYGAMECPQEYLGSVLTTFGFDFQDLLNNKTPVGSAMQQILSKVVGGTVGDILAIVADFFNNNCGMMALCPSYEFLNSDQLYGEQSAGGLIVNGKKIGEATDRNDPVAVEAAKRELYDFYNTLHWALYYDESGNVIHYEEGQVLSDGSIVHIYNGMDIKNGVVSVANLAAAKDALVDCDALCLEKNGQTKVQLDVNGNPVSLNKRGDRVKFGAARLKTYYERLFVDGAIAMSPENGINSYIFLGTGIKSSITGIKMTAEGFDGNGYPTYTYEIVHDDHAKVGEEGWIGGDGMVCRSASLAGLDENVLRQQGRLYEYPGFWHADVGGAWPLLGDDVMALLEEYISKVK